jgi:hypothetical protein
MAASPAGHRGDPFGGSAAVTGGASGGDVLEGALGVVTALSEAPSKGAAAALEEASGAAAAICASASGVAEAAPATVSGRRAADGFASLQATKTSKRLNVRRGHRTVAEP